MKPARPLRRARTRPRRGPADIPPELWRDRSYLTWLRLVGRCIVCGASGCDPMHGPPAGMRQKAPDAGPEGCVPGCRPHHDEQTRVGWPAFERKHRISRRRLARKWWKRFQEKDG